MTAKLAEKHEGTLGGSDSLRLWLRLLSATMTIEKRVRRGLVQHHGTTLPRFDVMAALDRNRDGMTMGALSRMLLVSNGNVTSIVKALTVDNLVAVSPDPQDGRVSRVVLTTAGIASFATLADSHHGWIDAMFNDLESDEQARLYDLLGRLKQSVVAGARGEEE